MRFLPFLLIFVSSLLFFIPSVQAESLASIVSGRILLDVENHGEAWYVDPVTQTRYYLQDGDAAYAALERFGLGITDADLAKIPIGIESRFELSDMDTDLLPDVVEDSLGTDAARSDSDQDGVSDGIEVRNNSNPLGIGSLAIDMNLTSRLLGRILLQVETHGEAWYINPADSRRYYLGNGEAAYQIMRYVSLGITSANLAQIPIGSGSIQPPVSDEPSEYQSYTLTTSQGSFAIKMITLRRDAFEMVTDTGDTTDCLDDCSAYALETYVARNEAFAGIHGTYFCPPDYTGCASSTYSYLPPVFNSALDTMINDDTLIFHDRPLIAQTTDGAMHFFHRAENFGDTLADYEFTTGLEVNAAIGNWPSLMEDGESVVDQEPMEATFSTKSTRGGIGWNEHYFYLVIASNATVENLASIFDTIGADSAMNLDGGGSAALYYDGTYKVGPGRLLPNAVLFREKSST